MKNERLLNAIGEIDETLINDAVTAPAKKKGLHWTRWVAIAACFCLIAVSILTILNRPEEVPILPIESQCQGDTSVDDKKQSTAEVTYTDEFIKIGYSYDLAHFTEEEMFAMEDIYIFRGIVRELKNIVIDFNGSKVYKCIATVVVNEVYRGEIKSGDELKMLLPCPIDINGYWQEDTGVIGKIEEGMEGIFMPQIYDKDSGMELNGEKVFYREYAHCGLGDGERWAFLETERGIVFASHAYTGATGSKTLEDIEAYIKRRIQ